MRVLNSYEPERNNCLQSNSVQYWLLQELMGSAISEMATIFSDSLAEPPQNCK